jgi:hypothetical protein
MNLIETLLSGSTGSGIVQQLGSQFGLDAGKVTSVVGAVAPLLAHGLKEKLASDPTGGGLLSTLQSGSLAQYAENPSALASPEAAQQGQSILGSLFGTSGGALNNVLSAVSGKTGVSSSLLQSILPVLATLVMGFLSKQTAGDPGKLTSTLNAISGEHAGLLSSLKAAAGKLFG